MFQVQTFDPEIINYIGIILLKKNQFPIKRLLKLPLPREQDLFRH